MLGLLSHAEVTLSWAWRTLWNDIFFFSLSSLPLVYVGATFKNAELRKKMEMAYVDLLIGSGISTFSNLFFFTQKKKWRALGVYSRAQKEMNRFENGYFNEKNCWLIDSSWETQKQVIL